MKRTVWLGILAALAVFEPNVQATGSSGSMGSCIPEQSTVNTSLQREAVLRNQADLWLGNCGGSRGGTVDIDVFFSSTVPVSAIQFDVQFNASRLSFVQAAEGPVAIAADKKISNGSLSTGTQRFIVVGLNQTSLRNGVLAYLRFRIADDSPQGNIPLALANFVASSPQAADYRTLSARGGGIDVVPSPVLARISPESGPPRSLIVLSGINLGSCRNSARVIFSGSGNYLREVVPSEATSRRIAVEVPADALGTLNVGLDIGGAKTGTQTFTIDTRFPYRPASPQIDDVNTLGTGFVPGSVCFNRRINVAYFADTLAGTVTAIHAGTRSLLGSVPVGSRPLRMAVNPMTGQLVVCSSGGNSIAILGHGTSGSLQNLGQLTVGRNPTGVAVNPLTNRAVITNADENSVTIVDLAKRAVIGTVAVGIQPVDVAIDLARNRAFIANSGDATVSIVDLTANRVAGTIANVGSQPRAVEFHLETGTLLVGSSAGLLLRKVEGAQLLVMLSGQSISDIILHPARGLVFAVNGSAGMLFVIDLNTALIDPNQGLLGSLSISDGVITGGAMNPFTNQLIFAHRISLTSGNDSVEDYSEQSSGGGFSRVSLPISLNFPRALTRLGDMLGVAISNTGTDETSLQLTAIADTGQQLQGTGITNPYTATLPGLGQMAAMDFQIFGDGSSSISNFWFHMTSPNPGMKAFFLTGDFVNSMVGTEENGTLLTDSILPAVKPGDDNVVSIINPLPVAASVSMDLVADNGSIVQSLSARSVPAFGLLQARLNSLFSSLGQMGTGGYLRLRSTTGIRSYQQFVPAGRLDPAGLNAQSALSGPSALYFSHFVAGSDPGIPYETRAVVVNLETTAQTLAFTIRDESGALLAPAQNQNLAANGRMDVDVRSLFNLPSDKRTQGWLKVEGSGKLAGYLTYATAEALAAVVSVTEPRTQLTFSQVAEEGTGYYTGLAILNANTEAISVDISVYNADGILVAATETPYSIPPNGRIVDLLNRLVHSEQVKNQQGGYVVVSASQPIHGIEIFGTSDSRAFANVPAQ